MEAIFYIKQGRHVNNINWGKTKAPGIIVEYHKNWVVQWWQSKLKIRNINATNDCSSTNTTEIKHKENFRCESYSCFIQQNLHHLHFIICSNLLKVEINVTMTLYYSHISNDWRWNILVPNSTAVPYKFRKSQLYRISSSSLINIFKIKVDQKKRIDMGT